MSVAGGLPRLVSRSAAALAGLGLLLLGSGPAFAVGDDSVRIDHAEAHNGVVEVLVSIPGEAAAAVSGSDVAISLDGRAIDARVSRVTTGDVARSAILVVDASNSMRGAKFKAATDAVTAYLATAPSDVSIGMVAFAGDVTATHEPSGDRTGLLNVLKGLPLQQGTSVYDALEKALAMAAAQPDGFRSLVVLSDGADTASEATLSDVVTDAVESDVVVDVVSLGGAKANVNSLIQLAERTSGRVIEAGAKDLGAVLSWEAESLQQQLLASVDLPSGISGDTDITVTVDYPGGQASATAVIDVGTATERTGQTSEAAGEVVAKPLISGPMLLVAAALLFVGLAMLLWQILSGATGREAAAKKRLEAYFGKEGQATSGWTTSTPALKDSAVAAADRVVSHDLDAKISRRLTGAGSGMTSGEWVLTHAGIAVGTAVVLTLLSGFAMGFLGFLGGLILPWMWLARRHRKRLAAFNAQLAETLDLISGGLQAGLSMPQAVDTVVQQGSEPMVGELRRALVEQRLGVDITDALENVGDRMESDDFGWAVIAMRIQREVGGNLAEILRTVSETLREREYLRRQVRSLSAEGRISGYILTALPLLVFAYMIMVNRPYVAVLWTTFVGWLLLGVALVMLAIGSWAMRKLSTVEI